MATVRNKTVHTLDLRCIGRAVEADEKVDVPDDIFDTYTWPTSIWETGRDSKAEPKRSPARKTATKEQE